MLRVHLWDISGHPDYQEAGMNYSVIRRVFLVFDVTNRHSFDNLEFWLKELNRYCTSPSHVVVVANKIDIKAKRVVQSDEAMRWATGKKVKYYETSASSGEGITRMFTDILQEVMTKSSLGTR
nr:dnaJ homolog subfamily C member 27-like [Lytechinus pictus]